VQAHRDQLFAALRPVPLHIIRNYAKNVNGLFTRIIGKISVFTVLQYINKNNNKPIGQVKYALL